MYFIIHIIALGCPALPFEIKMLHLFKIRFLTLKMTMEIQNYRELKLKV